MAKVRILGKFGQGPNSLAPYKWIEGEILSDNVPAQLTYEAIGTYDFGVSGGKIGSYTLTSNVIPQGAHVTDVIVDIATGITSTGGTGTVALTLQTAGDLLAAVDADTISGLVQGIPTSGTASTYIKTTADRNIVLNIATANLLTGKFTVYAKYSYNEANL